LAVGVAIFSIFGKRLLKDGLEADICARTNDIDTRHTFFEVCHRGRHRRFFLKGRRTRDHLKQDHSQRIQIATVIDLLAAADLLGRHIRWRTERMACDSVAFVDVVHHLGDPKVHHFGDNAALCLCKQQVPGLEIAVDHTLAVGVVHPFEQRADDRHKKVGGGWKGLIAQPLRQRQAFDPIHHKAQKALLFDEIQHTHDVRMLQAELDLRFHPKAVLHHFLFHEVAKDQFDGDGSVELDVLGSVHISHPPLPNGVFKLVLAAQDDPVKLFVVKVRQR